MMYSPDPFDGTSDEKILRIATVLGYTSLWLAIAADTGATLLVIANSLRLLRIRGAV